MHFDSAVFISDLHLNAQTPRTLAAFEQFCAGLSGTHALYVLGDLFEAYVGDDDLADPINTRICAALAGVAKRGAHVLFMHGNRDFLVGDGFANATGAQLLPDPVVHTLGGMKLLISHGDAWCTDDVAYQQFRAQARSAAWQAALLALPLAQRKAKAAEIRMQSETEKRAKPADIMDVNLAAVLAAANAHSVTTIVHGHTHRPALHHHPRAASSDAACDNPAPIARFVLSDWDFESDAPRANALRIDAAGPRFEVIPKE
ncbi:MAG: UDP-2,3-diacylglucosamine diphosphatase [Burkholderiaceae bacterium]